MKRMIEEDISLDDFMAFNVAAISLQSANSIIIDGLALDLNGLVIIHAVSADLIE